MLHKETVRVKKLSFYGNTLVEILLLLSFFFFYKKGALLGKNLAFLQSFLQFLFPAIPGFTSKPPFYQILYTFILLYLVLYTQFINSIICKYVIQPSECKVLVILIYLSIYIAYHLVNSIKALKALNSCYIYPLYFQFLGRKTQQINDLCDSIYLVKTFECRGSLKE